MVHVLKLSSFDKVGSFHFFKHMCAFQLLIFVVILLPIRIFFGLMELYFNDYKMLMFASTNKGDKLK
jgi:hypothetical protein